jgi:hypothetical protein
MSLLTDVRLARATPHKINCRCMTLCCLEEFARAVPKANDGVVLDVVQSFRQNVLKTWVFGRDGVWPTQSCGLDGFATGN